MKLASDRDGKATQRTLHLMHSRTIDDKVVRKFLKRMAYCKEFCKKAAE